MQEQKEIWNVLYGRTHPPVFILYRVLVKIALQGIDYGESWTNLQETDVLTMIIMKGIQWRRMCK